MDNVLLSLKGQEVLSDAVIEQTERNLVKGDPSHTVLFLQHHGKICNCKARSSIDICTLKYYLLRLLSRRG